VTGFAQTQQSSHQAPHNVTAVRHWTSAGSTRIEVEVSGPFEYRTDRLHNPERVYYDIPKSRPKFDGKRLYAEDVDDPLVKRIRVAETTPGVTRVVFDLTGPSEIRASVLTNPDRLMVELRRGTATVPLPPMPPATTGAQANPPVNIAPPPPDVAASSSATPPARSSGQGRFTSTPATSTPPSSKTASTVQEPAASGSTIRLADVEIAKPDSPSPVETVRSDRLTTEPLDGGRVVIHSPAENRQTESAPPDTSKGTPAGPATKSPAPASTGPVASVPATTAPATTASAATGATSTAPTATTPSTSPSTGVPKPARHTTTGETSLVRALGLKLQRIVIDPGHGGHDEGTQGPKGLLEKELVLDVSLRLGKMVEEKLGAEVIYTRSDDTFIPLEGRTALANEKKADLFLSIHANSSPVPRITGVETYYLNFTDSKDAMDVASRENAGSAQSIFELRDILQKISQHDKASESRDFADRIQAALFAFSSKTFPVEKNRGVKKAPFVVLIGANMPSVLAEIGFVSNAREEALLKKPEYRQKLAEALFHGVSKYAESLSHFQLAAN
jgi:N-acetylmuramoyl-L-alanine amidase